MPVWKARAETTVKETAEAAPAELLTSSRVMACSHQVRTYDGTYGPDEAHGAYEANGRRPEMVA
jgi:hypothetical protein